MTRRFLPLLAALAMGLFTAPLQGQTPCENGFAAGYPCDQVDLMGFVPSSSTGGELDGPLLPTDYAARYRLPMEDAMSGRQDSVQQQGAQHGTTTEGNAAE